MIIEVSEDLNVEVLRKALYLAGLALLPREGGDFKLVQLRPVAIHYLDGMIVHVWPSGHVAITHDENADDD